MSHATGWRQQERELRVCDFRLRGAALKFFSPFVCARTQMRSATTAHTKHMIQACTMDKEHNSSTSDGVTCPPVTPNGAGDPSTIMPQCSTER